MNKLSALSILVLVTACTPKETLNQTFQRINTEVSQNSKAYETLREATSTIGHRLTGSENGRKAEEFVYNKFKEYGFDDVQYMDFEVEAWSRGEVSLQVDNSNVTAVTLGHSPVSADVAGELADMGNGLEADYAARPGAVKGKIAFFYIGILPGSGEGLRNLHRSEKTELAIKNGAIGVLVFNQVDKGVLLTGTASVTGKLLEIPAVCISKEDGLAIKEKIKVKKQIAHIAMTNFSGPIKARNVVATLKGSDLPDERIIIGGHLDSWDLATGAIDNGIGSFSVLDIARSFNASKLRPKRTIQFVMFMGEEQGLLGSTYMAEKEVASGSIEQVKFMMNLDMAGNPIGINVGGKADSVFFKSIGGEIQKIDTAFQNRYSNQSFLHSDHEPFMLQGVPILGVRSNLDRTIYRCYHSDCDDFELVNESHLINTVRFGTMILYAVADADTLPALRLNSEATRDLIIESNLKEPLVLAGKWRW